MNSFIDILSRMIIATITFVAPMIIFCFGIFFDHLKLQSDEKSNKQKEIAEQVFAEMSTPDVDKVEVLIKSTKQIEEKWYVIWWNKICSPLWQIVSIFLFLFLSIGSLMFSHLVKDHVWSMYNDWLVKGLIRVSFFTYGVSVIQIALFVRSMIFIKIKVERNKK